MALIICDECGKDVSDKAASCPVCGNPIVVPEANEGRSEATPLMRDADVGKKYQVKSSNIKQGLKRTSFFVSIIWMGCWYYNKEVTHSKWFGIPYYRDDYIYLGLFGLFCIWISQFLIYWVISGFIKDKKELALENDNYKKIVSNQFKNVEEIIFMKGETLFLIIVFVSLLFLLFREI